MKGSRMRPTSEGPLLAVTVAIFAVAAAVPIAQAAEQSDTAADDPDKEINESNLPASAKAERKAMLRPNDRSARIEAAKAHLAEGADEIANVDAAREHVLAVLAEQPNDAESLLLAGRTSLLKSESAEAARYYRAAIAADPGNASAFLGLGDALTRIGDKTGAAAAFERYRALKGMAPSPRAESTK